MRTCLFVLLLAGCASRDPVKLQTAEEVECGQRATEFVNRHYLGTKFAADGAPDVDALEPVYIAWAIALDRCMQRLGAY